MPLIFEYDEAGACFLKEFPAGATLTLAKNRLIINPGGVGQPRDSDPRASYATYDSETRVIMHYRIPYDIGVTQARMAEYRLPGNLITRLTYGV